MSEIEKVTGGSPFEQYYCDAKFDRAAVSDGMYTFEAWGAGQDGTNPLVSASNGGAGGDYESPAVNAMLADIVNITVGTPNTRDYYYQRTLEHQAGLTADESSTVCMCVSLLHGHEPGCPLAG